MGPDLVQCNQELLRHLMHGISILQFQEKENTNWRGAEWALSADQMTHSSYPWLQSTKSANGVQVIIIDAKKSHALICQYAQIHLKSSSSTRSDPEILNDFQTNTLYHSQHLRVENIPSKA